MVIAIHVPMPAIICFVVHLVTCINPLHSDSTVTVTNLWNVLKGVGLWFGDGMGLVECFAIPESRYWEIAYCTEGDRRQCFLEYWVATHPAPSWMVVAEALYLLRRVDSRQALEVVRRKYLIGGYICGTCTCIHMACINEMYVRVLCTSLHFHHSCDVGVQV